MFVIDPATNTFNDSLANSLNSLYISIKKLFNCIYNDTSYIENIKYKFAEDDFINDSDIKDIEIFIKNKLLDKINLPNKMFCTRIYEDSDYNNMRKNVYMHCFVLYYLNNKVYQIEHPNWERIGIYEFANEEEAIKKINNYYINMSCGRPRPVTEFFEVLGGLSFKEFNDYINSLDERKVKVR